MYICLKPLSVCGTKCEGPLTRNSGQIQSPDIDKDGLFDYGVECAWNLLFDNKTIELHVIYLDLRTAVPDTCSEYHSGDQYAMNRLYVSLVVFLDFSLTVKAAPHKCVIRTGQP